jgi:cytochrome b subunit of formate dehydrogenase
MNEYYRKLIAGLMLMAGTFLIAEHIINWGGVDVDDPIGHEYYGLILFIGGIVMVARWKGRYILSRKAKK